MVNMNNYTNWTDDDIDYWWLKVKDEPAPSLKDIFIQRGSKYFDKHQEDLDYE